MTKVRMILAAMVIGLVLAGCVLPTECHLENGLPVCTADGVPAQ